MDWECALASEKIPLRNLILISSASHFTQRMSFQIFFIVNLKISFFMAALKCVVVEKDVESRQKRLEMLLRDSFNTQYHGHIDFSLSSFAFF